MGYAQCKSFAYVDERVTDDNATRGSNCSAEAELIIDHDLSWSARDRCGNRSLLTDSE